MAKSSIFVKPERKCDLLECDKKHFGLGYCEFHYERYRRYGDPLGRQPTAEEAFFSNCIELDNGCRGWTGFINQVGTGNFRGTTAPHWAYEHFVEPVPAYWWVRAVCGTKDCTREDHLVAGPQTFWKPACAKGHSYEEGSYIMRADGGGRLCLECRSVYSQSWRYAVRSSGEKIGVNEIAERDGWVCQLCWQPIDRTLRDKDPLMKSIDHIHPISLGGQHIRDNVQIAHLVCNKRKGAKIMALTDA